MTNVNYSKNIDSIHTFLHFSYTFDHDEIKLPWSREYVTAHKKEKSATYRELVDEGCDILNLIFKEKVNKKQTALLPLSGGLDSRAILGGLLKHNIPTRIASFGLPGALDYEIPAYISKQHNLHHTQIHLGNIEWKEENIVEALQMVGRAVPAIGCYLHTNICNMLKKDEVLWSGYFGDPIAGSHLPKSYKKDIGWKVARNEFFKKSQIPELSLVNSDTRHIILNKLPSTPILPSNKIITYDEQLDFSVRQNLYVKHTTVGTCENIFTPFTDSRWVSFFLKVPNKYRNNCMLYKDILKQFSPDLFSIPSKTTYNTALTDPPSKLFVTKIKMAVQQKTGIQLAGIPTKTQMLNTFDYNAELRKKTNLSAIIYKNIEDLKKRNLPTVNSDMYDTIRMRHKKGEDLARTLLTLASCELNIKAGNIKI